MQINLERFKTQAQNSQQNILSYVFFYITLCYGIVFAFFADTNVIKATALSGAAIPPVFWGILTLLVITAVIASISFKWRKLGKITSTIAFFLWIYVFMTACFISAWFGAIVIAFPMLVFWLYWFAGVNQDNGDKPL